MVTSKIKLTAFDAADYLDSPEVIVAYLNEAFSSGDPAEIRIALGTVARAKGMSKIASKAKVGRQSLYKALDKGGNPSVDTLLKVMAALGLRLSAATA